MSVRFDSRTARFYIAERPLRMRDRETDLSAEPPRAQAPPRLSGPHGDRGRSSGDQGAPRERAQAFDGVIAPERAVPRLCVLKRRAEFLGAARGRRVITPAFVLLAQARPDPDPEPTIGVGFTVTRRLGKAVVRNRAKRRLREVARRVLPEHGEPGTNYVLVARQAVTTWPHRQLEMDLVHALRRLQRGRAASFAD